MDRLRASAKTLALIAVAILVAAGTYAIAAIPGSDGVITACWDHTAGASFGALRVIDPSLSGTTRSSNEYSCQSNETQITWNQQGPAGPVGPAGPTGPQGSQGPQGARAPQSVLSFTGGVKSRIFLSIPGIDGESTAKGHKGDIDLTSASVGSASGRVKMGEIIVVKDVDKSSPTLFKAVATGKHFPKVTITFRKAGRQPIDYLKFTMSTVIVSGVTNDNGKDPKPSEQVSLNFKKLDVEYKQQNHSTSIHLTPHQISLP